MNPRTPARIHLFSIITISPAPNDFLTVKIPRPSCDVQRVQIRLLSLLPSSGSGSAKSCFNCFMCASSGSRQIRSCPQLPRFVRFRQLGRLEKKKNSPEKQINIHATVMPSWDWWTLNHNVVLAGRNGPHFPYLTLACVCGCLFLFCNSFDLFVV